MKKLVFAPPWRRSHSPRSPRPPGHAPGTGSRDARAALRARGAAESGRGDAHARFSPQPQGRVPGGSPSPASPAGSRRWSASRALYFLPPASRVVHDLGLVAAGRSGSARIRIRAGSYLVVAFEGIAVAAARPLTVS